MSSCSIDPDIIAHGAFTSKVAKEARKNYDLYLYGFESALFNKGLGFSFISYDAIGIDEARLLIVELFENLLHQIHSESSLQPYLRPMDFDTKNLELSISFRKFDHPNERVDPPHVAFLDIGDDEIFYSAYDSFNDDLYTVHRESYQEAKNIIENQAKLKNLFENSPYYIVPKSLEDHSRHHP